MKTKESRSAFTLIELLVVVAIIGILVSLLFPVISSVRRSAKKSAARADMHAIKTAIDQYYAEYRRLPIPDELHKRSCTWNHGGESLSAPVHGGEMVDLPGGGWHHSSDAFVDTDLGKLTILAIATLQGSNKHNGVPTGFNPRETEFLERQEGRPLGHYMDPWSKGSTFSEDPGNRPYGMLLDHNLNDRIIVYEIERIIPGYHVKGERVVVRCYGPNRKIEVRVTDSDFDDLYSIDVEKIVESQ